MMDRFMLLWHSFFRFSLVLLSWNLRIVRKWIHQWIKASDSQSVSFCLPSQAQLTALLYKSHSRCGSHSTARCCPAGKASICHASAHDVSVMSEQLGRGAGSDASSDVIQTSASCLPLLFALTLFGVWIMSHSAGEELDFEFEKWSDKFFRGFWGKSTKNTLLLFRKSQTHDFSPAFPL